MPIEARLDLERDQLPLWLPVGFGLGIAAWLWLPDKVARAVYEAFGRGDVPAVLARLCQGRQDERDQHSDDADHDQRADDEHEERGAAGEPGAAGLPLGLRAVDALRGLLAEQPQPGRRGEPVLVPDFPGHVSRLPSTRVRPRTRYGTEYGDVRTTG